MSYCEAVVNGEIWIVFLARQGRPSVGKNRVKYKIYVRDVDDYLLPVMCNLKTYDFD